MRKESKDWRWFIKSFTRKKIDLGERVKNQLQSFHQIYETKEESNSSSSQVCTKSFLKFENTLLLLASDESFKGVRIIDDFFPIKSGFGDKLGIL